MICFQAFLLIITLFITLNLNAPFLANLHWNPTHLLAALLFTIPLIILTSIRTNRPFEQKLEQAMQSLFQNVFKNKPTLTKITTLALISGACEEIFFRGLIQHTLLQNTLLPLMPDNGIILSALLTNLLFAIAHWGNKTHVIAVFLTGIYFSLTFLLTENLLTPILIHTLQNFIACLRYTKLQQKQQQQQNQQQPPNNQPKS